MGVFIVTITLNKLLIAGLNKDLEHIFLKEFEAHQNIVHKICTLYAKDHDSHHDLFQEISIQLWKAYPKFRGDAKFSTWMYRVGINTAITQYRKEKKRVDVHDIEQVLFKTKAYASYDNKEEEQLQLMYTAIKSLNDIDKALIFLYLEDKNYEEISDTLGITEVNARVKMNRIKKKLKKIIKP